MTPRKVFGILNANNFGGNQARRLLWRNPNPLDRLVSVNIPPNSHADLARRLGWVSQVALVPRPERPYNWPVLVLALVEYRLNIMFDRSRATLLFEVIWPHLPSNP